MSAEVGEVRVLRMDDRLPSLLIPWPVCGHCGEDVLIEDGAAWCQGCLIVWSHIEDGAESQPDPDRDGTEVPCAITTGAQDEPYDDKRGNHYVPGPRQPCILPSGHEGHHICPYDVEVTR